MSWIAGFLCWCRRLSGGPNSFIVSYPKTGRTWLRVLIGKALCDQAHLPERRLMKTESVTAAAGVSRTRFTHDGAAMSKQRPFHELRADKSFYRGRKVLLLTRDIRDTLVSAYFQATKRIHVFDGSISDFIRDERFGARKILTFYRQWHEQQNVPEAFLALRYEDLHRDTADALARTLRFLGADRIDPAILETAVRFSTFENLKKIETAHRFGSGRLAEANPADPESAKVRKGRIGGYIEYLTADDLAYIDEHLGQSGCEFTAYRGESI